MLGKIFGCLCIVSLLFSLFSGNIGALGDAVLDGAKNAVNVLLSLAGMMCFWCGIMGVLSEAGLIRLLIKGYEPKEKPDDRFYDVMRELSAIGNNINQLAAKANTLGFIDAPMLKNEAEKWNKFQAEIERHYLRPEKSELKWQ